MNKKVLSFVNKLEGYKTAIKELHWDADNMSQHELCDKIADSIAEFQDTVSEVEQSITGKLATGNLKPESYKVTTLKKFVEDVLDATNTFYKSLEKEGDTYTGMRSDCESFLSDMQRNLYLVNFTMKEDLKRRIASRINEAYRKEENIKTTFHGTKPATEKGLFKRINDLTKNGQLNTRTFGGVTDVLDFYRRILGKIGNLRSIDACEGNNYVVKLETEGGLTYFGLLRIKEVGEGQCKASITFSPHADVNDGVEPEETEPTLEDGTNYEMNQNPYGSTDVTESKLYELQTEGSIIRMTGNEFHNLIKESVKSLLNEVKLKTKYGEISLHGNNAYDWAELEKLRRDRASAVSKSIDKARQRGWKYREDGDEEKARQEFDSISSLNNVADKEFRNRFRNGKNAEDLGYKYRNLDNIEGDRFEKLKSIKAMMDRATSPEEKHKYYQMYCDIEGDLKGRADAELNQYLELKNKLGKK